MPLIMIHGLNLRPNIQPISPVLEICSFGS